MPVKTTVPETAVAVKSGGCKNDFCESGAFENDGSRNGSGSKKAAGAVTALVKAVLVETAVAETAFVKAALVKTTAAETAAPVYSGGCRNGSL